MPKLDAVTLRQLRALRAVAETGSLAAAADQLGLTPPAVHAQIRNLEAALSVPMLQRALLGRDPRPRRRRSWRWRRRGASRSRWPAASSRSPP